MKKLDVPLKSHHFSKQLDSNKYTAVLCIQMNDPKNYSNNESLHLYLPS